MREYLLRHRMKQEQRLKYDFLPPLLEVIEKPAHIGGTIIIWSLFSVLALIIVWAVLFKVDVVVSASGTIQPEGELFLVQPLTSGEVTEIHATYGDYVEAGEVLVILSQELADIDLEKLLYNRAGVAVQQKIYERIYDGEEIADIREGMSAMEGYAIHSWEMDCVLQEEEIYLNNMAILTEQAKSAVSKEEAALQVENYQKSRQLEIAQKIASCQGKMFEYDNAIKQAELTRERNEICAPVSGYLTEMQVDTPGELVTAAQVIARIVPAEAALEFKCYLDNKDIADVAVGKDVQIKLNAYPYSRYGTAQGIVSYVSPAASMVEGIGNVYTVLVTIYDDDRMEYISGMNGVAEIQLGKRSVMEYFLEPITKGLGDSLKEK